MRILLVLGVVRICMVCAKTIMEAARSPHLRLCLRSAVKTNGGHAALRSAAAGLLAIAQNYIHNGKPRTVAAFPG